MIDTICINVFGLFLMCTPGGDMQGYASWYQSDHIMDATIALRQEYEQIPTDLSKWDGFVATMSCDLIGETIMARLLPNGKDIKKPVQWREYLVTDCSGHLSTTNWMAANSILVEFGARTAKKLGIHGQTGVPIEAAVVYTTSPTLPRAMSRLVTFKDQWQDRHQVAFR